MVSLDNSLLELLRGVHVDLTRAVDASTTSLARPRARLAWIASLIPPECVQQRKLLDSAAQVAAEIGLGHVGGIHDATRLEATVAAVNAVVEYFANPRSEEGRRMMEDAVRQLAYSGYVS
ncbi:MAG: hypothetical protein M3Z05_20065 [Gemmatimonadota bacterium]|nr:hypothetical protein [Gemmatimonadota bacterium]